jgi:hypothetical protein
MFPVMANGLLPPPGSHVQPIAGTRWGVAQLPLRQTPSGAAIGSFAVGLSGVLLSPVVGILAAFAQPWYFWGPAVLGMLLGLGGSGLGWVALLRIRRSRGELSLPGLAVVGVVCGCLGLLAALVSVGCFVAFRLLA